jgi:hypothetical protein
MADSKLTIANMALAKLGAASITNFVQSGSNEALAINTVYDDVLEEVLSEHPWSFAQKRAALSYVVADDVSRTINGRIFTPVTITGATAANPVVITAADHGLANGDKIKIVGVTGMTELNDNYYRVADRTDDTFELVNEETYADVDGSSYTAYTSDGQIQLANDSNPISISGATAADPVVITATAHGLSDDDWIKIIGVAGMTDLNDTFYIVANATTDTFELTDTDGEDIDGSGFAAYTYGGIILKAPEMDSTDTETTVVVYQKPADMVKLIKKSSSAAVVKVEQDKIIADVQSLKIIYTFLNTDATQYFSKFTQALVTRLAAEIAFPVTNSLQKAEQLLKIYNDIDLPKAVAIDSTQSTPEEAQQDEWLNAHLEGTSRFATTGQTWHPV